MFIVFLYTFSFLTKHQTPERECQKRQQRTEENHPRRIPLIPMVFGSSGWEDFYIPENLDFRPDPETLYKESQSISWNEEHAQKYRLRFTDHFRLVVSVEPVEE